MRAIDPVHRPLHRHRDFRPDRLDPVDGENLVFRVHAHGAAEIGEGHRFFAGAVRPDDAMLRLLEGEAPGRVVMRSAA